MMKFYPLRKTEGSQAETGRTATADTEKLAAEYKAGREIGVIKLGETHLYFRKNRKVYYVPYQEIRRCFRRVMAVPMKLCCGKGDLEVEHLVICDDSGEIAQIQLPGTRAAKILMEELKEKIPEASFSCPEKPIENPSQTETAGAE